MSLLKSGDTEGDYNDKPANAAEWNHKFMSQSAQNFNQFKTSL